jgi:hypothetical protein
MEHDDNNNNNIVWSAEPGSGSEGFQQQIKNIRHDLMLNEYPKEFTDSVIKPSIRNRPSSDTIYQCTVIIPYGYF